MYNYDNIIDEKMRDLKCFKCESMEELTSYRLAKVTNIKSNSSFMSKSQSYTYYTTGFNVPVCKECLKGIREWEQYKVKNKTSRICGGFLYFAVIILVSFIFMQGNSMGVQHLWFLVIFFGILISLFHVSSEIFIFKGFIKLSLK